MTGMEAMVNNLVKSLSGMTIDEIKVQAAQAQQHVLAFIKMVNDNFKTLDQRIIQHDANTSRQFDVMNAFFAKRDDILAKYLNNNFIAIDRHLESMRSTLDNMRMDLAPLLHSQGVDLTDDLIEAIKRRAGEGAPNGGVPGLILIPSKLEHVEPGEKFYYDNMKAFRVERPMDGVEPANTTQLNPTLQRAVCPVHGPIPPANCDGGCDVNASATDRN